MLEFVGSILVDGGLQAIGWAVMKGLTFGRYRGFRAEDILFEGLLGFATVSVLAYGAYRWLM
jgi:hypothetical protein